MRCAADMLRCRCRSAILAAAPTAAAMLRCRCCRCCCWLCCLPSAPGVACCTLERLDMLAQLPLLATATPSSATLAPLHAGRCGSWKQWSCSAWATHQLSRALRPLRQDRSRMTTSGVPRCRCLERRPGGEGAWRRQLATAGAPAAWAAAAAAWAAAALGWAWAAPLCRHHLARGSPRACRLRRQVRSMSCRGNAGGAKPGQRASLQS